MSLISFTTIVNSIGAVERLKVELGTEKSDFNSKTLGIFKSCGIWECESRHSGNLERRSTLLFAATAL